MPSELALEIQQHLIRYLAGEPLADFENWFMPIVWEIDTEDDETRTLAGTVHILISEFSRGDRTLEGLRGGFMSIVQPPVENRYGEPISVSRSNADSSLINVAA